MLVVRPNVAAELIAQDLLDDPGALYESGSQKAEEYYRQVESGWLRSAGLARTRPAQPQSPGMPAVQPSEEEIILS